ncbi:hypothetical protein L1I30_09380 [Gillisia sp. M10.2A]|uniref:PRMT5 arginine-N-methyltransferase domain-containing protein n=1 Tax=Gillisia lutea TaxID=2909668 RepID=A0ABS9EG64_9FLAO|nr:hypothetical protein [Gillisia lutea]MCF4101877.1 hypothetical protein [Gillisia lutea]
MKIKEEINRITSQYFCDEIDYEKLNTMSLELKNILKEICDREINNEEGRLDIQLENGKALGTFWAAACIDDIIRTRQFIRGINQAITEKINENTPLHILYAGTGPFATLILPFIFRYTKQEIKYTLLEINPLSFKILNNVISKFGLEGYNIKLLNEDATKYQIEHDSPDIIISETMQNALAKEQQVPIFYNLMSQVKPNTIFIPEKIEIFIGLRRAGIPSEQLQTKHYQIENKVFEVSKETLDLSKHIDEQTTEVLKFPKIQTILEKERIKAFNDVVFITKIQVYKEEKIGINESGLTTPITILDISKNQEESVMVETQYTIGDEPQLKFKIASPNITGIQIPTS